MQQNIFIINTSGGGLEFVLNDKHKYVDTEKQSIALPMATEEFITECGKKWSDLSAIGVIVGPGSFTGIRLGIAYAKGLSMGLNIPLISVNAFELYLAENPDAFVAIESGRGDFFVGAANLPPCTMDIDTLEYKQMQWPRTVGHRPFNLKNAVQIVIDKLSNNKIEPVVPMYLRPSYAEENAQKKQNA